MIILLNAIAKAHRWQMLYERGGFTSLDAFAEKYGINVSYVARILRLNLLAPFPALWSEQREKFGFQSDSLAKPPVINL